MTTAFYEVMNRLRIHTFAQTHYSVFFAARRQRVSSAEARHRREAAARSAFAVAATLGSESGDSCAPARVNGPGARASTTTRASRATRAGNETVDDETVGAQAVCCVGGRGWESLGKVGEGRAPRRSRYVRGLQRSIEAFLS